ncbi:MAG: hypothetical protein CMA69_00255, partial [Euryarchaeota archaeon]|nr:hypothetical protein [Euryarchaeota archaeon]
MHQFLLYDNAATESAVRTRTGLGKPRGLFVDEASADELPRSGDKHPSPMAWKSSPPQLSPSNQHVDQT